MPLALLDVELDFDFRPKALNATCFVPGPDIKPDTPSNFGAGFKGFNEVAQRLVVAITRGTPFLDTPILIRHGREGDRLRGGRGVRLAGW